jgi:hypothetical protein
MLLGLAGCQRESRVGWYLMTPPTQMINAIEKYKSDYARYKAHPPTPEPGMKGWTILPPEIAEPPRDPLLFLFMWRVYSAYDSASECERARKGLAPPLSKWY